MSRSTNLYSSVDSVIAALLSRGAAEEAARSPLVAAIVRRQRPGAPLSALRVSRLTDILYMMQEPIGQIKLNAASRPSPVPKSLTQLCSGFSNSGSTVSLIELFDEGGAVVTMETRQTDVKGQTGKRLYSFDMNHYATKKSAAQSMLDVALLMANSSQLKTILYVGPEYIFYIPLIVLLSLSIILQVIVGLLLVFIGNRHKTKEEEGGGLRFSEKMAGGLTEKQFAHRVYDSLQALSCPLVQDLHLQEEESMLELLCRPSPLRTDILTWICRRINPKFGSSGAMSAESKDPDGLEKKMAAMGQELMLCKADDLDLIQGKASPQRQLGLLEQLLSLVAGSAGHRTDVEPLLCEVFAAENLPHLRQMLQPALDPWPAHIEALYEVPESAPKPGEEFPDVSDLLQSAQTQLEQLQSK
ncbi:hypothetical protein CCH79_00017932, partial [Gambusia affinis]